MLKRYLFSLSTTLLLLLPNQTKTTIDLSDDDAHSLFFYIVNNKPALINLIHAYNWFECGQIESFYRFGDENDATIKLVKLLFYADAVGTGFHITQRDPLNNLTPELIGMILKQIDDPQKFDRIAFDTLFEKITKKIKGTGKKAPVVSAFKDALINSLNEQFGKNVKYPPYTTHLFLLAFLLNKVSNLKEIAPFMEQFGVNINKIEQIPFSQSDEQKLKKMLFDAPEKAYDTVSNLYQFYSVAKFSIIGGGIPSILPQEYAVTFEDKQFADCVETLILNFFRHIVLNNDNTKQDYNYLPATKDPKLIKFLTENIITPNVPTSLTLHNEWAKVVSAIPNIEYIKGNCELESNLGNILKVINHLLFKTSKEELSKMSKLDQINRLSKELSNQNFSISLAEEPDSKKLESDFVQLDFDVKTKKSAYKLLWSITPGHSELKVIGDINDEYVKINEINLSLLNNIKENSLKILSLLNYYSGDSEWNASFGLGLAIATQLKILKQPDNILLLFTLLKSPPINQVYLFKLLLADKTFLPNVTEKLFNSFPTSDIYLLSQIIEILLNNKRNDLLPILIDRCLKNGSAGVLINTIIAQNQFSKADKINLVKEIIKTLLNQKKADQIIPALSHIFKRPGLILSSEGWKKYSFAVRLAQELHALLSHAGLEEIINSSEINDNSLYTIFQILYPASNVVNEEDKELAGHYKTNNYDTNQDLINLMINKLSNTPNLNLWGILYSTFLQKIAKGDQRILPNPNGRYLLGLYIRSLPNETIQQLIQNDDYFDEIIKEFTYSFDQLGDKQKFIIDLIKNKISTPGFIFCKNENAPYLKHYYYSGYNFLPIHLIHNYLEDLTEAMSKTTNDDILSLIKQPFMETITYITNPNTSRTYVVGESDFLLKDIIRRIVTNEKLHDLLPELINRITSVQHRIWILQEIKEKIPNKLYIDLLIESLNQAYDEHKILILKEIKGKIPEDRYLNLLIKSLALGDSAENKKWILHEIEESKGKIPEELYRNLLIKSLDQITNDELKIWILKTIKDKITEDQYLNLLLKSLDQKTTDQLKMWILQQIKGKILEDHYLNLLIKSLDQISIPENNKWILAAIEETKGKIPKDHYVDLLIKSLNEKTTDNLKIWILQEIKSKIPEQRYLDLLIKSLDQIRTDELRMRILQEIKGKIPVDLYFSLLIKSLDQITDYTIYQHLEWEIKEIGNKMSPEHYLNLLIKSLDQTIKNKDSMLIDIKQIISKIVKDPMQKDSYLNLLIKSLNQTTNEHKKTILEGIKRIIPEDVYNKLSEGIEAQK